MGKDTRDNVPATLIRSPVSVAGQRSLHSRIDTHQRLVLGDPWDFDCAVSLCMFLRSLIVTPASSAWVSACAATFSGPSVVLSVVAMCMHTSISSESSLEGDHGCC